MRQEQASHYRSVGHDDWAADPSITTYTLDAPGAWEEADDDEMEVSGRLIGGCLETVANLAGTPFGDVSAFGRDAGEDGLLIYLEVAEVPALETCRRLHGLRLAGWFQHANAILIGRTAAPDSPTLTQREAVLDALGDLDLPIIFDVECGHVPPYMPLVNGALAHLTLTDNERYLVQELR